jgi:uncharacterized membrane protein
MPGLRTFLVWVHVGGVVVWFGAIAYFLLILRPAVAASGMERGQWYLLLRAVKRRLRRVVGVAVAAVVLVRADAGGCAACWTGGWSPAAATAPWWR